jgi:hypothetical protein
MRVVSQAMATKGSRLRSVQAHCEAIPGISTKRKDMRAGFARQRPLFLSTIQR